MVLGRFRQTLIRYINYGGCLSRKDLFISLFSPLLPFLLNAKRVSALFNERQGTRRGKAEQANRDIKALALELRCYNDHEPLVEKLKGYILNHLGSDLYGAYFHGSIAAAEKIDYSDVDALIIIKDEVFQKPKRLARAAYKLNRALKYFYKIDPLQHHGWFVLVESDLFDYPQTYLPQEILQHARSIFTDRGLNLEIFFDPGKQDYRFPFFDLCLGIRWQLENGRYPGDMYQLKGLLSRFMLLPALYCQARDRKGIFKKFSFDAARKDFPASAWAIMDEVSAIRSAWHYSLKPLRRFLMTRRSPLWIRLKRRIGPRIPPGLKEKLSPDFYRRMLDLIAQMEEKLYEIQVH